MWGKGGGVHLAAPSTPNPPKYATAIDSKVLSVCCQVHLSPLTTRHTSVSTGGIPFLCSLVFAIPTSVLEKLLGFPYVSYITMTYKNNKSKINVYFSGI